MPCPSERGWSEQILPGHAPEHVNLRTRGDPGGEKSRRGPVDGTVPATRDLVQGAESQATPRQTTIDLLDTEGERQSNPCTPPFQALDAPAKVVENGSIWNSLHRLTADLIPTSVSDGEYVPVLF